MGKIVGVGGGNMETLETLNIDKAIVELTGKNNPKALLIPTATYDSPQRWEIFKRVYGARLGCKVNVLYLLNRRPAQEELEERILSQDLIYVSGGNTLKMMNRWRRLGVDAYIQKAYHRGIVLAGQSAGMICWFAWGHSDSMSFYHPDAWSYIRVKGMGLIDAIGCPHYNSGTAGIMRRDDFHAMMRKHQAPGIAIDNHASVQFVDGEYRVVTSQPGVGAYQLRKERRKLVVEELPQRRGFTAMPDLFLA